MGLCWSAPHTDVGREQGQVGHNCSEKQGRAALGQKHSFEFNMLGSVLGELILGKFVYL